MVGDLGDAGTAAGESDDCRAPHNSRSLGELDAVCGAAAELGRASCREGREGTAHLDGQVHRLHDDQDRHREAIRAVVSAGGNPYAHSRERLDAALDILVGATTEASCTRAGINVDDVLMALSGIAMAAGEPDQRAQAGRMLDLLFEVG
jgi:hypothetical protein